MGFQNIPSLMIFEELAVAGDKVPAGLSTPIQGVLFQKGGSSHQRPLMLVMHVPKLHVSCMLRPSAKSK